MGAGDQDGAVFPTSRGVRAELRRRRVMAARLVLVSAAPIVGLAVAAVVFDSAAATLLAIVVSVLALLPVVRALSIIGRGRGHFQPFLLVLLLAAGLVQAGAAGVAFAAGSPGDSALLLAWAVTTAVAARQVQQSQLLT